MNVHAFVVYVVLSLAMQSSWNKLVMILQYCKGEEVDGKKVKLDDGTWFAMLWGAVYLAIHS